MPKNPHPNLNVKWLEAEEVQRRASFCVGDMVDFTLDRQFPMVIILFMSFLEISTLDTRRS